MLIKLRLRVVFTLALVSIFLIAQISCFIPLATARIDPVAQQIYVKSNMGNTLLRIWRSPKKSNKTVVLLDGMRARNDYNGWELYTNAHRFLISKGINVVEPVGGKSSFYTDWIRPSSTNKQKIRYTWETFLTRNMPQALNKIGIPNRNMGVVGISMAASSALVLAAYHPELYNYAGALSGYLAFNVPGIKLAIRLSMLEAGKFNIDDMWGPPWSFNWYKYDPMIFMDRLIKHNKRIWISTGNGIPNIRDFSVGPDLLSGMGLEAMSVFTVRLFQLETLAKGYRNAMFDFTYTGVHNWPYWYTQLVKLTPDMIKHIG